MKLTTLEKIFTALNAAQVRYLVAGGMAVNAHGYLRYTKDVDFVIQLTADNIGRTFTALNTLGIARIYRLLQNNLPMPRKEMTGYKTEA